MNTLKLKSPINLPERTSGKISIKHHILTKGSEVAIISMRSAFTRGTSPLFAKLPRDLRIHELHEEEHGTWMTDKLEELQQINEAIEGFQPHGHVLVGGLGLGILATILRDLPGVKSVTVIERSADVINLCKPKGVKVIPADILDYLQAADKAFDCYMIDTWQGTNEGTWWRDVLPIRRAIANRFGWKKVWCWAENIMLGQCRRSAQTQGGLHWHYKIFPKNPSLDMVDKFFNLVGLPMWEKKWGTKVGAIFSREKADQPAA